MNDRELNELLKHARVPEREAGYWEGFPSQVTAELERRKRVLQASRTAARPAAGEAGSEDGWSWASVLRVISSKPAWAVGVAVMCLALGFFLGFWKGQGSSGTDPQLADVRKYYRELAALFPNQLQAIVFDQKGTHMVLAPQPDVPASAPLYVKVYSSAGCQRFVTFSGQQIRLNGEVCDVLTDHEGHVLVVGQHVAWSSAKATAKAGGYRIEAQPLTTTSG